MIQACAHKTFTLYYVPAFHNISDCNLISIHESTISHRVFQEHY